MLHVCAIVSTIASKNLLFSFLFFSDDLYMSDSWFVLSRTLLLGMVTGLIILVWNYVSHLENHPDDPDRSPIPKAPIEEIGIYSVFSGIETSLKKSNRRKLSTPVKVGISIFIGMIVNFILLVFRPFDLEDVATEKGYLGFMGIGVITAIVVYVFEYVIPVYFHTIYRKYGMSLWLIVGHITSALLIAGIVCRMYLKLVYPDTPEIPSLQEGILYALAIGGIPALALLTVHYIFYLTSVKDADTSLSFAQPLLMTDALESQPSPDCMIFDIQVTDIVLCSAMSNYVKVYYLKGDVISEKTITKKIVRTTLGQISDQIQIPRFIQCHRSHIVNMEHVNRYSGNAKGMRLWLVGLDVSVQVSRSNVPIVKQWMDQNPSSAIQKV